VIFTSEEQYIILEFDGTIVLVILYLACKASMKPLKHQSLTCALPIVLQCSWS